MHLYTCLENWRAKTEELKENELSVGGGMKKK